MGNSFLNKKVQVLAKKLQDWAKKPGFWAIYFELKNMWVWAKNVRVRAIYFFNINETRQVCIEGRGQFLLMSMRPCNFALRGWAKSEMLSMRERNFSLKGGEFCLIVIEAMQLRFERGGHSEPEQWLGCAVK